MEELFGAQAGAMTREENNVCGNKSFRAVFSATAPVSEWVTATVTDPSNNTSQFSACEQVVLATDVHDDGVPNDSDNCPAAGHGPWRRRAAG